MLAARLFFSLCTILSVASVAHASAGDWEVIKSLPPGTPISVKARLRHMCSFERATDNVLECSPKIGPSLLMLSFERKEVRQVRLEHSDDTNSLIRLATGGAIGFAIGASGHKVDTGSRVFEGAIAGAIVGWVGHFMNRAIPITHRNVIYRRK